MFPTTQYLIEIEAEEIVGISRDDRARHEFGNIIYTSRGEAEEVLSHLVDLTIEYGEATVAAFYELSNIESQTHR